MTEGAFINGALIGISENRQILVFGGVSLREFGSGPCRLDSPRRELHNRGADSRNGGLLCGKREIAPKLDIQVWIFRLSLLWAVVFQSFCFPEFDVWGAFWGRDPPGELRLEKPCWMAGSASESVTLCEENLRWSEPLLVPIPTAGGL